MILLIIRTDPAYFQSFFLLNGVLNDASYSKIHLCLVETRSGFKIGFLF